MKVENILFYGFVAIMIGFFVFSFVSMSEQGKFGMECESRGGITLRTLNGLACADKVILLADNR